MKEEKEADRAAWKQERSGNRDGVVGARDGQRWCGAGRMSSETSRRETN